MELRLKASSDNVKSRVIMAVMALAFGLLSAMLGQLGMLLVPLVCAPFAVVLMLERGKRPVLSVTLPILLVTLDAVFNGVYSFSCLCAVGVAFLIYVSLARGYLSKGDSAVASVLLVSVLAFITVLFYGCLMIGSFDLGAALEYYRDLVDTTREKWVEMLGQYALSGADPTAHAITPEALRAMYDAYVLSLYSAVVIAAFITVGISYKLFVRMMASYVEKKIELYSWRFSLSPIYALSYVLLLLLSLFSNGNDGFSIVVANLSNVIMVMLAYMGFMLTDAYFRMKSNGRRGGKLIVVLSVLLLGSVAMLVISLIGIFASLAIGKAGNVYDDKNNSQGGNDAG